MTLRRKSRWNHQEWLRRRDGKSEKARHNLRVERLSAPITPERIAAFVKHLVAVSFGAESECWLYAGCGRGTTDDLTIRMSTYANYKFNKETVGPHQFAACAAEGITLSALAGFDVHHAAEYGRCLGYRCANPDHLERVPKKIHRGTQGDKDTLARFQTKVVREVLGVPANARRPVEHLTITGAGSRRRFLGGIPFLIRLGVMDDVLGDVAEGFPADSAEAVPA
jgi:hypothetical protein